MTITGWRPPIQTGMRTLALGLCKQQIIIIIIIIVYCLKHQITLHISIYNVNNARALKKKHPSLDCSKADKEFTECHAE